jgi:hypothetical protein
MILCMVYVSRLRLTDDLQAFNGLLDWKRLVETTPWFLAQLGPFSCHLMSK